MKKKQQHRRQGALALALLPLAVSQAMAAQMTANYTGASGGSYGTAANWDINQVPLNNASNSYIVTLGGAKRLVYSVPGLQTIDQLLLDTGTNFEVRATTVLSPTQLTVLGRTLIGGSVGAVDGGVLLATGAGTAFIGSSNAVYATGGGIVRVAAPSFDASGASPNTTVLNATGANSLIDLSTVRSFNAGTGNGYPLYVTATTGGRIDLSGVTSVTAPASDGRELVFTVNSGARLDLTAVQSIAGVTGDSGYTRFSVDGATVNLGPLQQANRLRVELGNAAVMTLGGYAGTANITNSTFNVSGGSKLNAAALVGTLNETGTGANAVLLNATGTGSVLDLSGIRTFNAGQNTGYPSYVTATSGARINLSGVTSLIAPASNGRQLVFTVNSGAALDMTALQTLGGVTADSGVTVFNVDGATVALGPLRQANQLQVNLGNAAVMSVGGYNGSANLTNSTFSVSGGARLNAAALVGVLDERGTGANVTLLSASDTGSVLDLSGIRSFNAGQGTGYPSYVYAGSGARLDLSGVTTLVAPATTGRSLTFTVQSGALLDLSSVQTMTGVTLDSGFTTFSVDAATVNLGPVVQGNRLDVRLGNGAVMTMGGAATPAAITNSYFSVTGGARLNAAGLVGTLNESGTGANETLLNVSGSGSLLNLSGLRTLNFAQGTGYPSYVSSSSAGRMDLSGTTTLVAPTASNRAVIFNLTGASTIALGALQTIDTQAGGAVNFNVASGSSLQLGSLVVPTRVAITLTDAGSALNVAGGLTLQNGSTLAAGTGTQINLRGSFSFEQRTASQMNTDTAVLGFTGGGNARLEVGGRRLATLPASGGAVTGNFALGRLVLGQAGEATIVTLADAVDNGNRSLTGSTSEVLYLNGFGGLGGLSILGGSTLVLGSLDLYTTQSGQWLHVNDLFTGGQTLIAYDQGYISLAAVPEPATWALWGLGMVGLAARRLRERRLGVSA